MQIRTFVFSLCALVLVAPSAASAQFITDIPWTNLSNRSPILLIGSSTFNNGDGTVRLCVSFRNVSNKTATGARITFELDDLFGHPLREAILDRSGSFAPGIAIEGKMDALGGNSVIVFHIVTDVHHAIEITHGADIAAVLFHCGEAQEPGEAEGG